MEVTYRHNDAEIAVERFDDGTVMINFLTGRYFALNPLGELLWSLLRSGATGRQLASFLAAQPVFSGIPPATIEADVTAFLAVLAAERLVAELVDPGVRSNLEAPAVAAVPYAAPHVDVFDDLADLILLDPIHDVNEKLGWPVVRQVAERE
jgi:hypothetical protein